MKFYFTLISLFVLSTLWIVYLTFSPKKSEVGLTRFLSIEQIHTVKAAERIRLGGLVKPGSIKISRENQLDCVFEINQVKNLYWLILMEQGRIFLKMKLKLLLKVII